MPARSTARLATRATRDRLTPDDLNVPPAPLGAPLARPGRRLLAIGIDPAIVAALSNHGNFRLLAGFGLTALVHLRDPLAAGRPLRRWGFPALAGLRVVELTGKPITAMRAFKRYGGCAAGISTGLLGFAQVLRAPERQGDPGQDRPHRRDRPAP